MAAVGKARPVPARTVGCPGTYDKVVHQANKAGTEAEACPCTAVTNDLQRRTQTQSTKTSNAVRATLGSRPILHPVESHSCPYKVNRSAQTHDDFRPFLCLVLAVTRAHPPQQNLEDRSSGGSPSPSESNRRAVERPLAVLTKTSGGRLREPPSDVTENAVADAAASGIDLERLH